MRLVILVLAGWLGAFGAALADQSDSRLDGLFERLQSTRDTAEASALEQQIWGIWFDVGDRDAEVRQLMQAGSMAMNSGSLAAAEALFGRVVERAPDFAEGWNRRATVRYMRGDFVGSVADIGETLALEPRHFGALSGLGLCYAALQQPERAIAAFRAALEINPHLPGPRANIEMLEEEIGGEPI